MTEKLPPATRLLINHYFNIRVGKHLFPCPYFQNVAGKTGRAVSVGKGTPSEIEKETANLFKKLGKDPQTLDPSAIRHYMVMAGIGIDCSGFTTRVVASFLREKGVGTIRKHLKPNRSLLSSFVYLLRPYTNLSADDLTSKRNCVEIKNINQVLPGDLIKVGRGHVAIVEEVIKDGNKTRKIAYCHSTSDYLDQHGVRRGEIIITEPKEDLANQTWKEFYQGRNWNQEDYLKAKPSEKGIRRLKVLV